MATFVRWTLLYIASASALNFALRGDAVSVTSNLITTGGNLAVVILNSFALLAVLIAIAWRTNRSYGGFLLQIFRAGVMVLCCCIFLAAFTTVKTALPLLAEALGQHPFFADPIMADFDQALLSGVDAWRYAHATTEYLGLSDFAQGASPFYGLVWAIPGFCLPAISVLLGDDERQVRYVVLLYFFVWIVLGNVIAFAGLSAGPVYYDRLFDSARFADLRPALLAGGLEDSWIGSVQPMLWKAYVERAQTVGSGISAFPSVHVAMATVTAIYLMGKSRLFGSLGIVNIAIVFFVSIWSGYHYAVDGIFSILTVLLVHIALKRLELARTTADSRDYNIVAAE